MRYAVILFALGVWTFQQLPSVPPAEWMLLGTLALTAAAVAGFLARERLSVRWRWVLPGLLA
jgi:hypothetical protein